MRLVSSLCFACWCACGTSAYAELKLDLNLATKPSYRGILQATDNNPVPQGLMEYVADNGWYAGAWASRLHTEFDDRDSQVDFFVGYQHRFSERLAIDTTLQRYTYQGGEFGNGYDWTELQVAAHIGDNFTIMAGVGDNWIGRGERSSVLEASYRYAINDRYTMFATIGQHYAEDVIPDNFAYREVGINTVFLNFGLGISWTDTTGARTASFRTDDTLSLTISRRFKI